MSHRSHGPSNHHGWGDGWTGAGGHTRDPAARPRHILSNFLELYGRANRGAVPERNNKPNLSQALHVLAGGTYIDRLGRPNSRLARLLASGASDEDIFTEFYFAALSRPPAVDEMRDLKTILAQRGDREAGLREFVWALISSREFAENH